MSPKYHEAVWWTHFFCAVHAECYSCHVVLKALHWRSSYRVNEESLREAFSSFGDVDDAIVVTDRDSGRSKGFGFVTFSDTGAASTAITAMDGKPLNGRNIHVSFANDKPRNSFGGRSGGGGGYGNQRY
ncbi:glycine-rich RNA-binding protein 2, mitochondrial-like [Apium graveolens]|uniref:glycine-rich RNA-binding protein 2, mitochondrial-like n=1 Tax=Apium graveolens TaxID=4045 RepID=UPI003D7B5802